MANLKGENQYAVFIIIRNIASTYFRVFSIPDDIFVEEHLTNLNRVEKGGGGWGSGHVLYTDKCAGLSCPQHKTSERFLTQSGQKILLVARRTTTTR